MNPYSRFRLISNTLIAALIVGALCAAWPLAADMIASATGGVQIAYWASVAGVAALVVVASVILTEAVMPALFQIALLRRMVLGRSYAEGTWLQAERGPSGSERLTVLHIRPAGFGYDLSGYCLNQENEIESNRLIAWSKLDGPMLHYAYRSLMPDGAGNQAQGMSELMMEQRRGAPRTYSGYGHPSGGGRRFQIEGVKMTKWSERRRLRKLEQRGEIVGKYWDLFFGAVATETETAVFEPPAVRRPVIVETGQAPFVDRRNPENARLHDGPVIARRRASDWRQEDATPTADRIRSRMNERADIAEDDEEEFLLEDEVETGDDAYEADEAEEEMLEDEVELADEVEGDGDIEEEFEADAEDDLEIEDEAREFDAEAGDEIDDEDAEEAPAEEEPVRIRQRYARRS